MSGIALGSERELRATFSLDADNSPLDPDVVQFEVREPDGRLTSYALPDPEIERLEAGVYRVLWLCRRAGTHYVRWSTDDDEVSIAGESSFWVEYSRVLQPANSLPDQ